MNKLLDVAETAASGRRQQWLWCRKPKAAVALAMMAATARTSLHSAAIERQCGTTLQGYEKSGKKKKKKNTKKKSITIMNINLDRQDANKIETTYFLSLSLTPVSFCSTLLSIRTDHINNIYRDAARDRRRERERKSEEKHLCSTRRQDSSQEQRCFLSFFCKHLLKFSRKEENY